jgi:threonine dehydrogenase-like Zn-dependent dehydrogenase
MKTQGIAYLKKGGIRLTEVEVKDPGPGQVQVETLVCGICAMDLYAFKHGTNSFPFPMPAGHEGLSVVTKIGPGVTDLKEGDRVAGGSFAKVSNIAASSLHKVPKSDIPDEQWIVEPVSCVVTGVDRCSLLPGDRVAVIGCGFMGLMLIQLLGRSYVDRLVGIDVNPARLRMAKRFGADTVIDSSKCDKEALARQLKALELDSVIEATGSQPGIDLAERIVKMNGRLILFGWIHDKGEFSGTTWHLGGFTVFNASPLGKLRDTFPAAIRLIKKKVIDLSPLVTHVVPFEKYPDLLERVTAGKQNGYIKGVVSMK